MAQAVVDEFASLFRAPVDALLSRDPASLSGAETVELMRLANRHANQMAAVDAWLLSALGEKSLTGEIGSTSPADVLVTECRVSLGEARSRVRAARDLGPRRTVTGEPLEPIFAATAAALAEGAISAAQAAVIRDTLPRFRADIAATASPTAEAYLIHAAQHEDVRALREDAAKLLVQFGEEREPREARSHRRRDLTMYPCPEGGFDGTFHFTDLTGEAYLAMFDALAAPCPARDENGKIIAPDPRTAGQRRHDAMEEIAKRILRSGTLPATGGTPTTILVKISLAELRAAFATNFMTGAGFAHPPASAADFSAVSDVLSGASGGAGATGTDVATSYAQTQHGGLMSVEMLMHLACEANFIPVVLDDLGGIMAYGRAQRLASLGQRHALIIRDGGCVFPGCSRPASWTEVHHIQEWIDLGLTDIDNLCLLCVHHHHSFKGEGWIVEMHEGRPRWIPPRWLDPEQRPRRNRAHHLDDITFDLDRTVAS